MARKSTTQLLVGSVHISSLGENKWQLRYWKSDGRKDVRRRFSDMSEKDILIKAAEINAGIEEPEPEKVPGIEKGIEEVLNLSRMREHVRKMANARGALFVEWLARKYPRVKTWEQLKPMMLQAYMLELERSGLAFDTVRLRVLPVKMAWRHMAENYPEQVKPLPRVRQAPPDRKHEIECLEAKELAALLEWLKGNDPDLHVMACLQGLCGMRMLEAAALRIQDLDLKGATLTVTDTGFHRPKTKDSFRTIPVCGEALEALKGAIRTQKVKPASGELFTNSLGDPYKGTDLISHRWTDRLRKASRAIGNPRIGAIPARKLRAAFSTIAGRLGAPERFLKAYLGHVPGDVYGAHYRKITVEELQAVSARMDAWRTLAEGEELATVFGNSSAGG